MPVSAEAAGYGGGALAYASGRMGYDVGDADLFETSTTRQQLQETSRTAKVSQQKHTCNDENPAAILKTHGKSP